MDIGNSDRGGDDCGNQVKGGKEGERERMTDREKARRTGGKERHGGQDRRKERKTESEGWKEKKRKGKNGTK